MVRTDLTLVDRRSIGYSCADRWSTRSRHERRRTAREDVPAGACPSSACWRRSRAGCPAFVRPDHLTVLALAAAVAFAVAAATGHVLARRGAAGRALARRLARRHARPRPARRAAALRLLPRPPRRRVATALVGLGLGLSAHMHLTAALVLVIAYLALSINSYLETQALGRFSLGYGRLGPTEARLALIALLGRGRARRRGRRSTGSRCST